MLVTFVDAGMFWGDNTFLYAVKAPKAVVEALLTLPLPKLNSRPLRVVGHGVVPANYDRPMCSLENFVEYALKDHT